MGRVCKHEFEIPDKKNPNYSMIEYDLYARLGLTIRKNLKEDVYEIVTIKDKEVQYSYRELEKIVKIANQLEGADNTVVECGTLCPARRGK